MAEKVIVSREKLVAVADAIRQKTNTISSLTLDDIPAQIASIKGDSPVINYDGEYVVTPKTTAQTLETSQRFLEKNVEIKEIPYFETSNLAGGETVYIAKEIE
ncbi:MAG: hypothetical protein IKW35_07800 [Paludibacteraceae bacterium]|nr:hypothetical protein [Paludibacteraceae bacterium]